MSGFRGPGGRARGAIALLVAWLLAGSADAAIYRCTSKGRVAYRDRPCGSSEKQTRIGQGALAGCHEIEDVSEWEGGSGTWVIRLAGDGDSYVLREHFPANDPSQRPPDPENLPLRRATLEELDAVAAQYKLKVTGGFVLDQPAGSPLPYGVFNSWDDDGRLRLVALFSFANGPARLATCP